MLTLPRDGTETEMTPQQLLQSPHFGDQFLWRFGDRGFFTIYSLLPPLLHGALQCFPNHPFIQVKTRLQHRTQGFRC